jgi:hypothetical protein
MGKKGKRERERERVSGGWGFVRQIGMEKYKYATETIEISSKMFMDEDMNVKKTSLQTG